MGHGLAPFKFWHRVLFVHSARVDWRCSLSINLKAATSGAPSRFSLVPATRIAGLVSIRWASETGVAYQHETGKAYTPNFQMAARMFPPASARFAAVIRFLLVLNE
jgi:hypothetical protein